MEWVQGAIDQRYDEDEGQGSLHKHCHTRYVHCACKFVCTHTEMNI